MSRSFIYLRRAVFGVSCAIVFGFGATQASAGPQLDTIACDVYGDPTSESYKCTQFCQSRGLYGGGHCAANGTCECLMPVGGWPVE
ncbi:MAG TPA: hypothetical protein VFQ76_03140 [Longimicrobiaceae bacterium]|nr:hypothetical protein [Longimicrobiaceae bacterium]